MATSQSSGVLHSVYQAALMQSGGDLTDKYLLECFLTLRDGDAFAAMVRRHGPMVWDVCCRMLHNQHDAEDAFQATFFVLARKAASITRRCSLGAWLHGTAYRAALEARAAQRRLRERQLSAIPEPEAVVRPNVWHDVRSTLDTEISRLPDKYREAVVVCDLEGRTRREAARRLGIAEGTLSGRLTTARRRLAKRLARYGLPATSSPIVLAPSQAAPSLCAKTPLGVSAIKAAAMVAAGQTTTGVISDKVCAIGEGVMKTMLLTKLKMAIAALSVVGLFLVCLSAVPHPALAEKLPAKRDQRTDGRSPAPRATNHLALRSTMDGHTDAVSSLAFSPDGKLIASGGEDFSIRIWDTAAGKHVLTWAAHQNMVLSLAFSPDGKLLASASSSTIHIDPAKPSPGAVKVWEPATGKEKVQLNGDAGWFSQVAFSPDNKVLAAADEVERKVRLWQAATGKELGALQDDGFGSINSIAFSPDGKTLVVGIANDVDPGAATVQIWDWAAEKVVLRLKATGGCWFVAFTPDGKTLVTVSGAGDLTLWDSEKFERRKSHKLKGTPYAGTAISPDGKTMALGFRMEHKKNQMFDVAGTVELRDNVMGDLLATITLDRSPRSLAFSPTEALLAIGCRGQEKQPLDKKGEGPRMVGGGAGAVQLWELPDLTKHRK